MSVATDDPVPGCSAPEDVAGVVLYLASDLAVFVTGCVLDVNGGAWFA